MTRDRVAVRRLLDDPDLANDLGTAAHEHVRTQYVGDLHLRRYADLFSTLLAQEKRPVS